MKKTQLSPEVLEDVQVTNEIFPGTIKEVKAGEYKMTIPVDEPVSIELIKVPSRSVPRMYLKKDKVTITHLEPVTVYITYFQSRPSFQIQSHWLTMKKIIEITQQVEEQFQDFEQRGLFMTLISVIQQSVPQTIDMNEFTCQPLTREKRQDAILEYEQSCVLKDFMNQKSVMCEICYEEYAPNQFLVISACGHHICKNCLSDELKVAINNSTGLVCPYAECREEILPWELRGLCEEELVTKYDTLLTLQCIKSSGDFLECPYCHQKTIVDKEMCSTPTTVKCSCCERTFCSVCLKKNHEGKCHRFDSYKKYKTNKYYDEVLLNQLALRKLPHCPSCKRCVMKSYGCNYIHCPCGVSFCYLCGQRIHDYDHFGGACQTFTETSLTETGLPEVDTTELDKIMKNPNTYPYVCEKCSEIISVDILSIAIVCPHCGWNKCVHCDEVNVSKEHMLDALQSLLYSDYELPHLPTEAPH